VFVNIIIFSDVTNLVNILRQNKTVQGPSGFSVSVTCCEVSKHVESTGEGAIVS